ncbi:sensor histidine kinase [Hyalangium gracile]|uniref:sensor histidine kinase n=1 Tax=Hyalangium gracile TaxID=394092 RepID=UPI001CC92856|nr:PAS domain-containing sensor histidine kinase [Hyalangium gracile]
MNGLRELLASRRGEILSRLEREARERLAVEAPARALLVGSLPGMLDALQEALSAESRGPEASSAMPPTSALPPSGLGAMVLLRAHGLLREVLLGLLEESGGTLQFSELRVLHRFLDQALEATALEGKRAAGTVARNAAQLEAILESIPDAVYVGDAESITHANAPARELLGENLKRTSPVELAERLQYRDLESGERIPSEEVPFARALRGEAVTRDMVLRHAGTGRALVARCAAAPVRMGEHIVGAVVISTDMTEPRKREEELRRSAEFRERFLGIVSHDLRNPLNAIALSASVLLREEDLAPRTRKVAGRISQSAERMGRMISDLLDFTRGRLGGGIPITRQSADLRVICRPVLEELRVARPERELRLRAEGELLGEWDADRLAQLVGNLVKNALDYSPPDMPVTVAMLEEGAWVRLEVHNLGEPISPLLLPKLFEPFRRGMRREESSQSAGLGLGLFIAHQIALAHEGMLEVRSTREEGTTFTVRLPRAPQGGARP